MTIRLGWTCSSRRKRLGELVPVVEGLPPLPTHSSPAIVTSSSWAARRTVGVTITGTIDRCRRGRSGCRSPAHCHLARALDLAVRTWPDECHQTITRGRSKYRSSAYNDLVWLT